MPGIAALGSTSPRGWKVEWKSCGRDERRQALGSADLQQLLRTTCGGGAGTPQETSPHLPSPAHSGPQLPGKSVIATVCKCFNFTLSSKLVLQLSVRTKEELKVGYMVPCPHPRPVSRAPCSPRTPDSDALKGEEVRHCRLTHKGAGWLQEQVTPRGLGFSLLRPGAPPATTPSSPAKDPPNQLSRSAGSAFSPDPRARRFQMLISWLGPRAGGRRRSAHPRWVQLGLCARISGLSAALPPHVGARSSAHGPAPQDSGGGGGGGGSGGRATGGGGSSLQRGRGARRRGCVHAAPTQPHAARQLAITSGPARPLARASHTFAADWPAQAPPPAPARARRWLSCYLHRAGADGAERGGDRRGVECFQSALS